MNQIFPTEETFKTPKVIERFGNVRSSAETGLMDYQGLYPRRHFEIQRVLGATGSEYAVVEGDFLKHLIK